MRHILSKHERKVEFKSGRVNELSKRETILKVGKITVAVKCHHIKKFVNIPRLNVLIPDFWTDSHG